MARRLRHRAIAIRKLSLRLWQFLEKYRSRGGLSGVDKRVHTRWPANLGKTQECNPTNPKAKLGTNNSFALKANVCLAGAPLFEGRWIPDSGEIITARL